MTLDRILRLATAGFVLRARKAGHWGWWALAGALWIFRRLATSKTKTPRRVAS
jgi:hypothetical protein